MLLMLLLIKHPLHVIIRQDNVVRYYEKPKQIFWPTQQHPVCLRVYTSPWVSEGADLGVRVHGCGCWYVRSSLAPELSGWLCYNRSLSDNFG